jgi:threonine dehydrogenase-like Zn-dependent dehydrogenase
MKAVRWYGTKDVRVENVPDPEIVNGRDAILRITSTAICGSDLHLYNGYNPAMKEGDILGHEFMGEVVAVGKENMKLKEGDRVLVPFNIACGACLFCRASLTSLCDNSNPNAEAAAKVYGYSPAGLFGYSHLFGGFAGGQAEYVRVPFADVGAFVVPDGLTDEQVLFLTDIFPTGYMAAENCDLVGGETVAVWGCGPVGQFTIRSLFMLGAERVIAIDSVPERLAMAKSAGAETINYEEVDDVSDTLKAMTGGLGPHCCVDAVGMEAHGGALDNVFDWVKQTVRLETDRPHVLRQAIYVCRKGGRLSMPGVYSGFIDKIPMGAFMNKGLTLKTGQTHVHRYVPLLMEMVQQGKIDPSFIITHRATLDRAPELYDKFENKEDNCIKVVMNP